MLLFFFARLEVVGRHVPRRALLSGTCGCARSLAIASVIGLTLRGLGLSASWWLLAIALSTTSLGTLVPILEDGGLLGTPLGIAVLGTGVTGEF